MRTINWHDIRPIHNSLNDGFEELVCQLASIEVIKGQKHFQRIGKPDAGKECYWLLENGELYMWQAKYFTGSLNATQWLQIDSSVKKAIDNHPKLSKYYISFPLDMPDGKVKSNKSMLDKWKEKVVAWKKYAATKNISVEFEFWGSSQLISKLSKRENEGLTYFWFNKEEFSDEWLSVKNAESINALGARYTEELNFELPIAKVFNGLSRDREFEQEIYNQYSILIEKYSNIHINIKDDAIVISGLNSLETTIQEIIKTYNPLLLTSNASIPFLELEKQLNSCIQTCEEIESHLYFLRDSVEDRTKTINHYSRPHSNAISEIQSFASSARNFIQFLSTQICILANKPYLLLTGDAGMGKSHLLADIIQKRKKKNQPSLLLLGENFTSRDMPWTQILQNQIRKTQIDEFVFLGALNAKAESERTRLIIFIDAINEGNGRYVWPKRLKSFIQLFEKYPWLGLVISIRTSFVKLIAPKEDISGDLITRLRHTGFSGVEYAAVKRFFYHYKIVQPSSPFLNPEFQNPLFLKLFCKSLSDRGAHEIPAGYEGITSVIDYFLESINIKLALPEELDFDNKRPLVKSAVEKLLLKMVDENKDYVEYLEADTIVNSVFDKMCNNKESYLKKLISEGVLNDDLFWDGQGKKSDGIYFAYQRFQDHLTVSLLLDKYLNPQKIEASFKKGKLHSLVKDVSAIYSNQNLIEALSIQLPERTNKELFEVIPKAVKQSYSIAEAFIQSLIWRKNETIGSEARQYVNDVIIHDGILFSQFLETTLLASMKPGFYFNAERLHSFLMQFSLAGRDELWTTWLQDQYHENMTNSTSVKRLIDFAWNIEDDFVQLHDDSILLGCITLSWFLTSSNRYLRDAATKALVCLLQNRVHLIPGLLNKFNTVNDPYVLERLYAVTYGAVLRTKQIDKLEVLSEYVYTAIFNQEKVFPHILLRDYARGVIEYTLHLKGKPDIDIKKVRPPYKSKALPKRFPSNETIDKKYKPKGESGHYNGENWGATAILSSMTTEYGRGTAQYGDFGRYIFERVFYDWNVDANGLSNYAVQRIFELGYDPLLFSEFDTRQGTGRTSGHKERIGKKYQWIVLHELLARVSDHHKLTDDSDWRRPKSKIPYVGPWYPNVRDIDITTLIRETFGERYIDEHTSHWWFNQSYAPWAKAPGDWIVDKEDLPKPENVIEVQDSEGVSWLWLEIHPEWREKAPLGANKWNAQRKRLWYQIRSYLIREEQFTSFKKSFSGSFYRGGLPESRDLHTVFDKEYYWSHAFHFFNKPYYSGKDWLEVEDIKTGKIIAEVHRTTEWYSWEKEFDCSKTAPIQYCKPTQIIQKGLNLKLSDKEGSLIDRTGKVMCFDPSVFHKSVSGLLIRKDELLVFLAKEKLILVWGVIGEKQIIGNHSNNIGYPGRLNLSGIYTLQTNTLRGKLHFEKE